MLETEKRNPATTHIDKATTAETLKMISTANHEAADAVDAALPQIEKAADAAAASVAAGGRIFYIGAGTSGRLAVVDASECPPTYGVSHDVVVAVMAGGKNAMFKAAENVEDQADTGRNDLLAHKPTAKDTVIGISASGSARYVSSALAAAREVGCVTVSISSNPGSPISREADIEICTPTGAEVVTGSTRMKAGTAQKMVLNMISTCAMVKTGKVYENLMINLRPTNIKLRARMIRIVCEILRTDEQTAETLLEKNDWNIRAAVQ